MTLGKIIFVLYTSTVLFFVPDLSVSFIVTTSFFIVDQTPSGNDLWNETICFIPISNDLLTLILIPDS